MRLLTAPILAATVLSVYGAGQPSISKPAVGDEKISGTFPVYDNCTPVLTLLVGDKVIVPIRVYVEPKRGEFKMELAAALNAGDKLKVKHACGQNPESTSDEVPLKVSAGDPPQIVSIAAIYGAKKIRVFYGPLSGVDSATLETTTCLESQVYKLTAEDLKKTDLEISLTRGLFCEKNSTPANAVKMTLKYKGKTNPDPVEKTIAIGAPLLELSGPIREGATKVAGKADAILSKVIINAYSGWRTGRGPESKSMPSPKIRQTKRTGTSQSGDEVLHCEETELEESIEVPVADGVFTATLNRPLAAGACVQAQPVFAVSPPTEVGKPVKFYSEPQLVRPVLEEWARLRGYFSLGSTIDHYNEQFNRQDYFVGWTSDALVWGRTVEKDCPKQKDDKAPKTCPDAQFRPSFLRDRRIQLNVFSEARVRVALATGDATTTANATPGAKVTASRLLPPDFKAAQSGFFQIGIHTPMSWKGMDFVNRGQQFSFYVSPIAKFGGEALDRDLVTYQLTQDYSAANTNGTIHREEVRRGVLPFYSYGARFGLFKYEFFGAQKEARNRQVTNDPIGYIDFTWGKAHAFRSYDFAYTRMVPGGKDGNLQEVVYNPPNQQRFEPNSLVRTEMSSSVRKRFGIEGRMKLFSLPALIGVDFNVRANARDWEPNQLRFVLAFRVDAQRALGRIFSSRFQDEGQ